MMKPGNEHAEFLVEANELLDRMGEDLSAIQSLDATAQLQLVNRTFRSAHSFKGLCSLFGHSAVADLAHTLEDLLDALRIGNLTYTETLEHCLLLGHEGLRALLNHDNADWDRITFDRHVASVYQSLSSPSSPASESPDIYRLPLELEGVLTQAEEHQLFSHIKTGFSAWLITVQLPLSDLACALDAVSRRITAVAELITSVPGEMDGGSGRIEFKMVVVSQQSEAQLSETVRADEGTLSPLKVVQTFESGVAADKSPAPSTETTAIPTIRVETERLDHVMHTVGELHLLKNDLLEWMQGQSEEGSVACRQSMIRLSQRLEKQLDTLRHQTLDLRTMPARLLFHRMQRVVRQTALALKKKVRLSVHGADTRLDKLVMEELATPLLHLLRNAVDHGIEAPEQRKITGKPVEGTIQLQIRRIGHQIRVLVEDDGAGIDLERLRQKAEQQGMCKTGSAMSDEELLDLVFTPGFSSRQQANQYSGRGVGLDVVRSNMARLGGTVVAINRPGKGLTVRLTMPMTMNLLPTLTIERAGEDYVLPISMVQDTRSYDSGCLRDTHYQLDEQRLPLIDLATCFGGDCSVASPPRFVLVLGAERSELVLLVDAIGGEQDSIIQPLGPLMDKIPGLAGAAVSNNERLVMLLDVVGLKRMASDSDYSNESSPPEPGVALEV